MKYINIHTHSDASEKDVISIVNGNIINFKAQEDCFYSLGIHPWNISKTNLDEALNSLTIFAKNKNILAIGECGLDKLIETDIKLQEEVFRNQIKVAEQLNKPLIIHCVKAFDDLIRIKKEMNVAVPMIVHGYNNNTQIAEQLMKNGFYISFGKALLNENSNASKIISTILIEKLFLETDDKDVSIKSIFEAASKHLKMDVEDLKERIYVNFVNVFNSPLERG